MPEEVTPTRRKTRGKKTTAKAKSEPTQPEEKASVPPKIQERKKPKILATGLEDYGKWKAMFKDHQRQENEPPFRRGRIWS
ncbi:cyanobactin biosynthesis PatC/TenC/TruC family protein [Pleurocapsa sp. PCC 7319]|uniref:cyanobactin biosynthesis PatC/TenC/TruC family protein n=1 Tax=Pleurocapsa sp. PCC 7319 TaxID=118161 RepID=UPI00034B14E1|nr:cyanobactin biosynthesis PatC/TenC/TruC family protein [Pleurocapsa sp. PCC 7319]